MHGDSIIIAFEELMQETSPARARRVYKALEIASGLIVRVSGRQWLVPSQSNDEQYVVMCTRSGTDWEWSCTCPDVTEGEPTAPRDGQCKHILAVIFLGQGRARALARRERLDLIIEEENKLLAQLGQLYERTGEHRQEWRLLVNAMLDLNQTTRVAWRDTVAQFYAEPFDFATWQAKDEEAA